MVREGNASAFDMPQTAANHAALSPLSFLERTAGIYPEGVAVVHGTRRISW